MTQPGAGMEQNVDVPRSSLSARFFDKPAYGRVSITILSQQCLRKEGEMIKRYNNLSFAWAIPGLFVQSTAFFVGSGMDTLWFLVGIGFLTVGLSYYAKAKGRSPAWCLMGFLSIIGLVVLACLRDLKKNGPKGVVLSL